MTRLPGRSATAVALVAILTALTVPAPVAAATATAATTERTEQASVPPTRALSTALDTVMAVSPASSCLTVSVDGSVLYQRNGSTPVVPASTEKLFTAAAALDLLGPDHRFTTTVVPSAVASAGVLRGDLTLVGGGDPQLTSSLYKAVRHLGTDRTITLLDDLAQKVADAGITHVTGRVLGDEARFDEARVVASWPARYTAQNQAGPLSALDVDDGYTLEPKDGTIVRNRADQPAIAAATLFTGLLGAKGVKVDGLPGEGAAPAGRPPLASIASAPLAAVVTDMLQHSDNQTAELLTKELGKVKGSGGTTAAGVDVIRVWRAQHGLDLPGTRTVDGSGLDPANRVTCDEMVAVLGASGGRKGAVASGLAVAATSGTLVSRFRNSPAAGRLRAKTGSLNSVTALTGFVDLPTGGTASFAYVANGEPVSAKVMAAQNLLATILATYEPPCPTSDRHLVAGPVPVEAAALATLAAGPMAAAALPGSMAATRMFASRFRTISNRCFATDEAAHVVLLP